MDPKVPPPFLDVEGVANFRDVGGYAVAKSPNLSVRRCYLYRCADPSHVTVAGRSELKEQGIKTMFDLRSNQELDQIDNPRDIEGVERFHAPAFREEDYSPESLAMRFKDYAHGGPEVCCRSRLSLWGRR